MAELEKINLIVRPPAVNAGAGGGSVVRDFLYGCWCNGRRIGGAQMPPLNELYLAGVLKRDGLPVDFVDAQLQPKRRQELAANGFSGLSSVILMVSPASFESDLAFLRTIKAGNPKTKTILFGAHPTFMPEYCLGRGEVDYIVVGEPEITTLELVCAIGKNEAPTDVKGAGWRDSSGAARLNLARPFVDLDKLPMPERALLPPGVDYFNPIVKRMPYTTAQTSRGCPFECVFCASPAFYGRRTRARSAGGTLEELREIVRLGYREVFFRDETFTAYRERNREIFEAMLSEGIDLSWIANSRVDMVDRDTLRLMKRVGCHVLKFGVETGDDALLRNYGKRATVEQCEEAFRLTREAGIGAHAHVIFGGPGETPETIEKTIKFTIKLNPATATFGILTPYPGSRLFEEVAAKHPEIRDGSKADMEKLHVKGFFSEAICGLSGELLSRRIVRAYRKFYLRPGYLAGQLRRINSVEAFLRLAIAGSNVLNFAVTGRK